MKLWRYLMILAMLLFGSTLIAQSGPSSFKLASFNIRAFSDRSRSDAELKDIAQLISAYDIVAIQETRDVLILERLVRMLKTEFQADFTFSASPKLDSGGGELYAFAWRTKLFSAVSDIQLIQDPANHFIREPAWQYFRASGGFDFVLIDYHALFGSSVIKRRQELSWLPALVEDLGQTITMTAPGESDIMLLGDFNMICTDKAFDGLRGLDMMPVVPGTGTTIFDSPYDNLWLFPAHTSEYTGQWGMMKFDELEFDNDDRRASQSISDHRPVWMVFSAGPDDD